MAPEPNGIAVTLAALLVSAGDDQQLTAMRTFSDAQTADLSTFVDWAPRRSVATVGIDGLHGAALAPA
jgi:hypothetical protein